MCSYLVSHMRLASERYLADRFAKGDTRTALLHKRNSFGNLLKTTYLHHNSIRLSAPFDNKVSDLALAFLADEVECWEFDHVHECL